jgi:hypothetical protein
MVEVLFALKTHFALVDIIRCISYILNLITLNTKYKLKNESIYLFCKFKENPPIFMKLS